MPKRNTEDSNNRSINVVALPIDDIKIPYGNFGALDCKVQLENGSEFKVLGFWNCSEIKSKISGENHHWPKLVDYKPRESDEDKAERMRLVSGKSKELVSKLRALVIPKLNE